MPDETTAEDELICAATRITAAHEVGHALCALALGITGECDVTVKMYDGPTSAQMPVLGANRVPDGTEAYPSQEAMIGYAGKLGTLVYLPTYANKTNDELWEAVHNTNLEEWSAEDLKLVVRIAENKRRKVFDKTVVLLRKHYSAHATYVDYIVNDFLNDARKGLIYTISSLDFQTPTKKSIPLALQ